MPSTVVKLLETAQRRALIDAAIRGAGWGAAGGATASLTALALSRLIPLGWANEAILALLPLGVVAGAVAGALRAPRREAVASLLDRQLGLEDRVGTVLALDASALRVDAEFDGLIRRETEARAAGLHARDAVELRPGGGWLWTVGSAALLAAAFVWLPERAAVPAAAPEPHEVAALREAIRTDLEQATAEIARLRERPESPPDGGTVGSAAAPALDETITQERLDELRRLAAQLAQPASSPEELAAAREQAAAALESLADDAERRALEAQRIADRAAEQFASMVRREPPPQAGSLADALRGGRFSDAIDALRDLERSAAALDEAQRSELASYFRDLAAESEKGARDETVAGVESAPEMSTTEPAAPDRGDPAAADRAAAAGASPDGEGGASSPESAPSGTSEEPSERSPGAPPAGAGSEDRAAPDPSLADQGSPNGDSSERASSLDEASESASGAESGDAERARQDRTAPSAPGAGAPSADPKRPPTTPMSGALRDLADRLERGAPAEPADRAPTEPAESGASDPASSAGVAESSTESTGPDRESPSGGSAEATGAANEAGSAEQDAATQQSAERDRAESGDAGSSAAREPTQGAERDPTTSRPGAAEERPADVPRQPTAGRDEQQPKEGGTPETQQGQGQPQERQQGQGEPQERQQGQGQPQERQQGASGEQCESPSGGASGAASECPQGGQSGAHEAAGAAPDSGAQRDGQAPESQHQAADGQDSSAGAQGGQPKANEAGAQGGQPKANEAGAQPSTSESGSEGECEGGTGASSAPGGAPSSGGAADPESGSASGGARRTPRPADAAGSPTGADASGGSDGPHSSAQPSLEQLLERAESARRSAAAERQSARNFRERADELGQRVSDAERQQRNRWSAAEARERAHAPPAGEAPPAGDPPAGASDARAGAGAGADALGNTRPRRPIFDEIVDLDLRSPKGSADRDAVTIAEWFDEPASGGLEEGAAQRNQVDRSQRIDAAQRSAERAIEQANLPSRYHPLMRRYFGRVDRAVERSGAGSDDGGGSTTGGSARPERP